mgnify:CR=1 FL=1|jgi:hypothetical protein
MRFNAGLMFLMILGTVLSGCKKEDDTEESNSTIRIVFNHQVNDADLQYGEMNYVNAAGNPYEVTEIMYFISEVRLYKGGVEYNPNDSNDIHYVDSKLLNTMDWTLGKKIPAGTYDSIKFIFGISAERNKSFLFVNPPEVSMAWPEVLGGGYHLLMMNGFWEDLSDNRRPFNFHLGTGQIYQNNSGDVADIIGFIHNAFTVLPEGSAFNVSDGNVTTINLVMDINSWFETPVIWDFDYWGGAIMMNQDAMHDACLNGRNAFRYSASEPY